MATSRRLVFMFQFTLPCRERPDEVVFAGGLGGVSIHAPV